MMRVKFTTMNSTYECWSANDGMVAMRKVADASGGRSRMFRVGEVTFTKGLTLRVGERAQFDAGSTSPVTSIEVINEN